RVLRGRRGHRLPVRHGRRRSDEEGHPRLRRGVPDSRGHPARERVRARRAADASGGQDQARVDELLVRSVEGEEGGGEPLFVGSGRARSERRLAGNGQFAESKGIPWVGYDSNARKFAKNSWLTASVYHWGPYYLRRVKA